MIFCLLTDQTRRFRQVWNFDTIHYTGSGTAILNLPNPSQLIAQQGTHRILALHNIGTGTMIVNDWNDDYLVVLSPTDYVKFQITLEGEGSGGTILGIPAPERRFEYAYSASTLGGAPSFGSIPLLAERNKCFKDVAVFDKRFAI